MMIVTTWDFLDGSPYSVPNDDVSSARLESLEPRLASLEVRCQAMRETIVEQLSTNLSIASRTTEIFESNAIEGKTATLTDTYRILTSKDLFNADLAIARYALHESLTEEVKVKDVVGLAAARILVDQYAQDPRRPLTESDIRDMHELILVNHHSAGRYKQYLNTIEGSIHVPLPPTDVPGAMNQLVQWFHQSPAPLVWRSAVVHAWFTHIHPFDDGNGRIARLLANYVLGFGSYPPLIIKSTSDRGRYISALGASDAAGDIVPLMQVFVRALDRQLRIMEDPDFGWKLFQKDLMVREDSLHKRWRHTLDQFLHEVSAHLFTARMNLDNVGSIGASDFEFLRKRNSAGNGWLAKVSTPNSVQELLLWVGHVSDRMYRQLEQDQVFPAIFLSERDPDPRAIKPYRKSVSGLPGLHDELCIVADEGRALIRRGDKIQRLSLRDAAELWARLLVSYLEQSNAVPR